MLFSGAQGKMIHEKNLKQKISWHCPSKCRCHFMRYICLKDQLNIHLKGFNKFWTVLTDLISNFGLEDGLRFMLMKFCLNYVDYQWNLICIKIR